MTSILIAIIVIGITSIVFLSGFIHDSNIETYLDKSVPFVGTDIPRIDGIDGKGILIAVIDTGVNYEHPDMLGWKEDGKVAGGYNLLWEAEPPLDTDGHGTQVAGVASADGNLQGVAPKSKILAYKVSDDGNNVSSDLIAQAVMRAVDDGADIINISMGITQVNSVIENAINEALARGVLVVVAAGNEGPGISTIGSPGRNSGSITVGATYNNLTSSLIATLDVADSYSYTVIPMVGAESLDTPIKAPLIPAGYAKESDFTADVNVQDAIVIAQRGSDVKDEMLYFSLKEKHAADAGAAALIVYNNVDGIFLGELIHEFIESEYQPRIPVVSMDRDEGLELLEHIANGTASDASLHLFHNPDYVAHFSSRGPVSPFYIKPDLMAPGVYINTTHAGSLMYNVTSGTSYAAPHVSGAAALLLEKNPNLDRHELKSILMTTTDSIYDAYKQSLSLHETGSGRLNITRAYEADIAILPPSFVVIMSEQSHVVEKRLEIRSVLDDFNAAKYAPPSTSIATLNITANMSVSFIGPSFIKFEHIFDDEHLFVRMTADVQNVTSVSFDANDTRDSVYDDSLYGLAPYGQYEGSIIITYNNSDYTVPFLLHYTSGSVNATAIYEINNDNTTSRYLEFNIAHPDGWEFAKIDVIDSITEETVTITATPENINHKDTLLEVQKDSTYWIDAMITSNGMSYNAYNIVNVGIDSSNKNLSETFDTLWLTHNSEPQKAFALSESLPVRQILMMIGAVAVVGMLGVVFRLRKCN